MSFRLALGHFARACSALFVVASLATGCRSAPPKQAASDIDVARAMTMTYGNYSVAAKQSVMTTTEPSPNGMLAKDTSMVVRPIFNTLDQQDGAKTFTLVTAAVPRDETYDCHACSPIIGMAVFTRLGSGWKMEASNGGVTTLGAWGKPPTDIQRIQIGKGHFAIEITDVGEGQGQTARVLVLLVPWEGTVSLALERVIADDDAGICGPDALPCYSNQRSIAFKPSDDAEYYDVELALSGTDLNNSSPQYRAVQVHGLERLKLRGGRYQQLSRQGDLTMLDRVVAQREGLR